MIGQLTGQIIHTGERFVLVNVGGIGYKVYTTPENIAYLAGQDNSICLWTHLVVKEDALDLYGFSSQQELDFFELLITVSGIGPKSALSILSIAGSETLRQAITFGQVEYLTKIGGIGKKSAEKIVLELKDKLGSLNATEQGVELTLHSDVLAALETMGYSSKEAVAAIKKIPQGVSDTGEKIKLALKQLGK